MLPLSDTLLTFYKASLYRLSMPYVTRSTSIPDLLNIFASLQKC